MLFNIGFNSNIFSQNEFHNFNIHYNFFRLFFQISIQQTFLIISVTFSNLDQFLKFSDLLIFISTIFPSIQQLHNPHNICVLLTTVSP
jgi:hypothetical protein